MFSFFPQIVSSTDAEPTGSGLTPSLAMLPITDMHHMCMSSPQRTKWPFVS